MKALTPSPFLRDYAESIEEALKDSKKLDGIK